MMEIILTIGHVYLLIFFLTLLYQLFSDDDIHSTTEIIIRSIFWPITLIIEAYKTFRNDLKDV